jgi:hypothetical protein
MLGEDKGKTRENARQRRSRALLRSRRGSVDEGQLVDNRKL